MWRHGRYWWFPLLGFFADWYCLQKAFFHTTFDRKSPPQPGWDKQNHNISTTKIERMREIIYNNKKRYPNIHFARNHDCLFCLKAFRWQVPIGSGPLGCKLHHPILVWLLHYLGQPKIGNLDPIRMKLTKKMPEIRNITHKTRKIKKNSFSIDELYYQYVSRF